MTKYGGKSNEELTSPFVVGTSCKLIPRDERLGSGASYEVTVSYCTSHTGARITPEYKNKSTEVLASAFIVGTCQLIPRSSFVYSDHMHNVIPADSPEPMEYFILCGSNAEFYIRPLITCNGDLDYLIALANELVIDENLSVYPGDRSGLAETVTCYKIEPYDSYPGFVRLRIWGEMTFNWKCNKYEFNHTANTNSTGYAVLDLDNLANRYMYSFNDKRGEALQRVVCGPAVKQLYIGDKHIGWFDAIDFVRSIWCPQWPKEAQVWLSRPRSNGWPTIDTIMEIVQNGCHVVYVQHCACRNDKEQWRLSFSLAEATLLMSWSQKQQIVYHLLRFFAKRELFQKYCPKEDEVLCAYHLKTLMLWTCEEMSPEWWNSSSVIAICYELLKILTLWLEKRHFPNYFIPEANLFQDQPNSKILERTIRWISKFCNSEILCHWFVDNYILDYIRRHFKPKENKPHFMDYLEPLLEIWNAGQFKSLDYYFSKAFSYSQNCRSIMKRGLNHGVRHRFQTAYMSASIQLKATIQFNDCPTIQNASCLRLHDNLLYILQTVSGLECAEIVWDSSILVETVNAILSQPKIIRSTYHNFPKACTYLGRRFQFLCAQDLMKNLTGSNSRSEFQLLSLMIRGFLGKALSHGGNGTIPAALAYLAALHFATSEYPKALRLCSGVIMISEEEEDKETLNAGCLLFIDDVARIVGLCVLQKRITENNFHYINRRLYVDLRLSPDVFARYLSVISGEQMSKRSEVYHDLSDSSFAMDVNLKTLIKLKCNFSMKSDSHNNVARQIVYCRPYSLTETEASSLSSSIVKERVLDALMACASENMTSFYRVIRKDFGYDYNTGDCYRALYLYKCRKYDKVSTLCERILRAPSKDSRLYKLLKEFAFANVLLMPPFDSFLDRDVQSLLGFHTLFYYLFPLNSDMGKVAFKNGSTFEHWFARNVYDRAHLSASIHLRYPVKCHYFLGIRFVARYLKLRCCFDCNLPYKDTLTEFTLPKTNLPFERIIQKYLLQRLHLIKQNSTVSSYH